MLGHPVGLHGKELVQNPHVLSSPVDIPVPIRIVIGPGLQIQAILLPPVPVRVLLLLVHANIEILTLHLPDGLRVADEALRNDELRVLRKQHTVDVPAVLLVLQDVPAEVVIVGRELLLRYDVAINLNLVFLRLRRVPFADAPENELVAREWQLQPHPRPRKGAGRICHDACGCLRGVENEV